MTTSLLNFRQPRTLVCLFLVALLHGLAITYLQLHARKLGPLESPKLALPTISLRLLPLVLQSVATPAPAPSPLERSNVIARERSVAPRAAIDSKQGAADPSPTLPLSEVPSDGIAPQLNLHVSKRDLADAAARRPSGLPIHMSPTAWQQFVKTLGPSDEIREERLSINRVRIHTKYGCYELEQTATQRIDPFNKSPNFVTNCRW